MWYKLNQSVVNHAMDEWRRRLSACVDAIGKHFKHYACRISSWLKWCKKCKNRLRLAEVIVKNKMSRFFMVHCVYSRPMWGSAAACQSPKSWDVLISSDYAPTRALQVRPIGSDGRTWFLWLSNDSSVSSFIRHFQLLAHVSTAVAKSSSHSLFWWDFVLLRCCSLSKSEY